MLSFHEMKPFTMPLRKTDQETEPFTRTLRETDQEESVLQSVLVNGFISLIILRQSLQTSPSEPATFVQRLPNVFATGTRWVVVVQTW